jgi:hypothetical protein
LNRYVYIDKEIGKEREKEKKRKGKGTRIVKEKEKKGRLFLLSHLSIARPSSALIFTAVGSVQTNSLPSPGM